MRRRVVVTGLGLVSSIGHDLATVTEALRAGCSGVRAIPEWAALGLKSLVAGRLDGLEAKLAAAALPKSLKPGLSDAATYACLSALDALRDAGLTAADLSDRRSACIIGSSASGLDSAHRAGDLLYGGAVRRIDPFLAFRSMSSGCSAAVAHLLGVGGRSYSISSACATGAHNVGHASELIRGGLIDRALCGGAEDLNPMIAAAFQALRLALSTRFNDTPQQACRPYDAGRDGLVLSGGAGVLLLEDETLARARGARVHAEVLGFGANSDPYDLVTPAPGGEPLAECMRAALADAGLPPAAVDYVNTHGTATLAGDLAEVQGLLRVFGPTPPPFSSTKGMTGHALGAAGAQELVYCSAMLEGGFMAPSINIDALDPAFEGLPIVRQAMPRRLNVVLSNSFGFGGTLASVVLGRAAS